MKAKLLKDIAAVIGEDTLNKILASSAEGIVLDIETETKENTNFRKVLYTGENMQLVLMSLGPNEDIGSEVHKENDQFFRIDEGDGKVVINGKETAIKDGSAFIIPKGSEHNVIASEKGLKLYSLYSPPHHKDGTIHKTKEDAAKDDESFDGDITESSVVESSLKPRFKVGTQFIRRGNKRKDVETVVDIYTTKNLKGDVVKIRYVTEHDFLGQKIRDDDVVDTMIALGLIQK